MQRLPRGSDVIKMATRMALMAAAVAAVALGDGSCQSRVDVGLNYINKDIVEPVSNGQTLCTICASILQSEDPRPTPLNRSRRVLQAACRSSCVLDSSVRVSPFDPQCSVSKARAIGTHALKRAVDVGGEMEWRVGWGRGRGETHPCTLWPTIPWPHRYFFSTSRCWVSLTE